MIHKIFIFLFYFLYPEKPTRVSIFSCKQKIGFRVKATTSWQYVFQVKSKTLAGNKTQLRSNSVIAKKVRKGSK